MQGVKGKLSKRELETYQQCLGHCSVCMLEGGCSLEKKLVKKR